MGGHACRRPDAPHQGSCGGLRGPVSTASHALSPHSQAMTADPDKQAPPATVPATATNTPPVSPPHAVAAPAATAATSASSPDDGPAPAAAADAGDAGKGRGSASPGPGSGAVQGAATAAGDAGAAGDKPGPGLSKTSSGVLPPSGNAATAPPPPPLLSRNPSIARSTAGALSFLLAPPLSRRVALWGEMPPVRVARGRAACGQR